MMNNTTKRPKKKPATPPPLPPCRCCCRDEEPPEDRHTFVFEAVLGGVPAEMSMIVIAPNGREAVGAAYLLADHFASECMKAIKKNGRKRK